MKTMLRGLPRAVSFPGTCRAPNRTGAGSPARRTGASGGGLPAPVRLGALVFVVLALLALPIFAHGCHGDDVDHEPLFAPFRLTSDDR